jgi:hypothetical protein
MTEVELLWKDKKELIKVDLLDVTDGFVIEKIKYTIALPI